MNLFLTILAGLVISATAAFTTTSHFFSKLTSSTNLTNSTNSTDSTDLTDSSNVLGTTDSTDSTDSTESTENVTFNIDSIFNKALIVKNGIEVQGDGVINGRITANNLIYSVKAGTGIKVEGGQNPIITNVGVTSLQGLTGALSLTAGDGMTISGLTINNADRGSSQNIFKTVSVTEQDDITAGSNTDTLTFVAGTGVLLTTDSTDNRLTIAANDPSVAAGWTHGTNSIYLTTSTDQVGIGTTTPSVKFEVVGNTKINGVLDLASSGLVNAGSITGATGFTSSGQITLSGFSTGVIHSNINGVLSSSAVNLTNGDVTGTLPVTKGGTGITSVTTGGILYGSSSNVFSVLGAGGEGQVLTMSSGIPTWGTSSGGEPCPTCLINNPGSSQTITPASSTATGLIIKQASSGSVDIFKVTNYTGDTAYLRVDNNGNVLLGNGQTTQGIFTVSPSGKHAMSISPGTASSTTYTGTMTSEDLTDNHTWTFPDQSGIICTTAGNCSGTSSALGGSGTSGYIPKWQSTYAITNSLLYDNGTNVGIGTTNPGYKLDVNGTGNITGATTLGSTLGVTGATTLSSTLDVTGATNLLSTLGVTGATTLSSTVGITGNTTVGGNLMVNGAGTHYFSAGNVGIGTTSPGYKLDVAGDINTTGAFRIAGSAGTTGQMLTTTGTGLSWATPFTSPLTSPGDLIYNGSNTNYATPGNGATITVVNSWQSSPASVIDSNDSTTWGSAAHHPGPWFIIDLSTSRTIGSYRLLQPFDGHQATQYTISTSDDNVNWTLQLTRNAAQADETVNFATSISARYWKFISTAGSGGNGWNVSTAALYSTSTVSRLAIGTEGQVLTVNSGVPAWTSQWMINGSNLSYSTGNVGIGTTSPQSTLNINGGTGSLATGLTFGDGDTGFYEDTDDTLFGYTGNGLRMLLSSTDVRFYEPMNVDTIGSFDGTDLTLKGGLGENILLNPTSGLVGIGTTSPVNTLDIVGNMAIGTDYASTSTAPENGLIVQGNVGIGINIPLAGVHISKWSDTTPALKFGDDLFGWLFFERESDGDLQIKREEDGVSYDTMYFQRGSGNVGIGTTSPEMVLDVSGRIRAYKDASTNGFELDSTAYLQLQGGDPFLAFDANDYIQYARSTDEFIFVSGATNRLSIDSSGNTTINSLGTGTVYSNNGVLQISDPSDRSLKDNVLNLSDGTLDKVLGLTPVSFIWKSTGTGALGFIAQDVKQVFPELVGTNTDGTLGLYTTQFIPVLTKAIQEQQIQINDLIDNNTANTLSNLVLDTLETNGAVTFKSTAEFQGSTIFKALVEFFDNVIFHKDVFFAGKIKFNKDTAGTAVISTYTNQVDVKFETPYETSPVIMISLVIPDFNDQTFQNEGVKAAVTNVTTDGFSIILPDLAVRDFTYNWTALAVDQKTTTKSESIIQNILGSQIEATPSSTPTITPVIEIFPEASATAEITP